MSAIIAKSLIKYFVIIKKSVPVWLRPELLKLPAKKLKILVNLSNFFLSYLTKLVINEIIYLQKSGTNTETLLTPFTGGHNSPEVPLIAPQDPLKYFEYGNPFHFSNIPNLLISEIPSYIVNVPS